MRWSPVFLAFMAGWTVFGGLNVFFQDYLGLEGYISYVREHWIELNSIWGLLITASGFFLLYLANKDVRKYYGN